MILIFLFWSVFGIIIIPTTYCYLIRMKHENKVMRYTSFFFIRFEMLKDINGDEYALVYDKQNKNVKKRSLIKKAYK